MRVLIIGGTGLISTAVSEQLLARGHQVTLLNRGKTRSRLPSTVPVILCDRRNMPDFLTKTCDLDADAVIDMVAFSLEDSRAAFDAFAGRIRHFIHCSTVCVYGGPLSTLPAREDEPHTPVSEYGINKSACEAFLQARFTEDGFPVTIIRPSHTYGEGGGLLHTLGTDLNYLDRMRAGQPVIVHGDGQGLWASAHISDVARAFANVLDNTRAIGQAYQVTGDEWMTWNQYHTTVAKVLGGRYIPVYIPTPDLYALTGDRATTAVEFLQWPSIFDNTKARNDLGYEYRIGWEEGVRRTIRWLDDHGHLNNIEADPFTERLIQAWELGRLAAQSSLEAEMADMPGVTSY